MINLPSSRRQALIEILLIFAVFFIQGAWPVPDVNEAYYLGKAIHFWDPGLLQGDFFMESPDTHKVFYFTFGWMSLWLSPTAFAWTGRVICWWLLAWAWRRLSFAVVPQPWLAVLTAALFGLLMEWFHLAGEWVIGGFEAKPLAYAAVLLALEALVRNRWNLALVLLGAASAMHVLVGGWVAVAAGIAWLYLKFGNSHPTSPAPRPPSPIPLPWPGILIGLLLALPGIVPSLLLDWGADRETVVRAHEIYVFDRLPHHLLLTELYPSYLARMTLLIVFWLMLGRWNSAVGLALCGDPRSQERHRGRSLQRDGFATQQIVIRRLRAVVFGAIVIALCGAAIHLLLLIDRPLAVGLLRFYWFRLLDFAVPLGVSLEGVLLLSRLTSGATAGLPSSMSGATAGLPSSMSGATAGLPSSAGNTVGQANRGTPWLWALAIVPAVLHLGLHLEERIFPEPPRSHKLADYEAWREACAWIARPGNVPPNARFLVPRMAQSFKWYTGHSDVVVWKDVPQDARGITQWRQRIDDVYATGRTLRSQRWHEPLSRAGTARLRLLADKYDADYLITERCDPPPDLDQVYGNRTYVIYRLR